MAFFILIEKADPCHPNPCENEGVCVQKGDTDEFECRCKKPYKPPYCKGKTVLHTIRHFYLMIIFMTMMIMLIIESNGRSNG